MIWNKADELAEYLNKYIQYNTFDNWINRLYCFNDERERIINIELLKAIKKSISYLNLSDQEKLNLLSNINKHIKKL